MNRSARVTVLVSATLFLSLPCFPRVTTHNTGAWPDTWPQELDPYRKQAKTLNVAHGIQETVFEISFDRRKDFERAWPHILKIRGKDAPLVLERGPSTYSVSGSTLDTGVRILWPPDDAAGALEKPSEYVVNQDGKWVPFDGTNRSGFIHRARVDVVLVTDGKIVDLNRIRLPGDTPIIDRRFDPDTPEHGNKK